MTGMTLISPQLLMTTFSIWQDFARAYCNSEELRLFGSMEAMPGHFATAERRGTVP